MDSAGLLSQYVRGGIYAGYTVIVEYKETIGESVYIRNQQFSIMLVFLDMSPMLHIERTLTQIQNAPSLPASLTSAVRVSYELNSYQNAPYNPYRENYATVMAALNQAVYELYYTDGLLDTDKYVFTYSIIWQFTIEQLQSMNITQDMTVYSTHITVKGKTYISNVARLKIIYQD